MRVLFAVAVSMLMSSAAFAVLDIQNPGDPGAGTVVPDALVPCTDDIYCSSFTEPAGGYIADGEWNPVSNVSGFMTTGGILLLVNELCGEVGQILPSGPNFDNSIPRGFAWDKDPASGKFWVGSWADVCPNPTAFVGIIHLDATGAEIGGYNYSDDPQLGPLCGGQVSGLGMDYATGRMWGIIRNNPAGTVSKIALFDTNVPDGTRPPLLGVWDVPWNGGPSSVSSAGLEYRASDCTIVANRQDANNLGVTELTTFQDVGIAQPTLLGYCSIVNTPCVGAGQSTNRPWGISLSEDPAFGAYVIFSDLNLAVGCATIEQPGDLHIIALPQVTGVCGTTAVEPSTWGQIKHDYK